MMVFCFIQNPHQYSEVPIFYVLQNILAVLVPVQASIAYPSSVNSLAPEYHTWDDASVLVSAPSSGILSSQDEFNHHGAEGMHLI